ncbi:hypothetical protein [Butyrivibrio sp. INlla16]|uniref:hypothetical protein n=1 Tax=Butyrivibrio sp. INlla16 TaxID=1520807 RepID=UPI00087F50D1|nr:hypothetical protein [Butyrivibrio sp. INlla16]SDB11072.1 hypothetical protein SAMN02910263_00531 [Butyrivibrio sp. INlla16]
MKKYSLGSRISTYLRVCIALCVLIQFPFCGLKGNAQFQGVYNNKVIFTAPSAEKLFDGTPLTEQIDVTAQGLPPGYTYKAVAEGSITYPEENQENNNIVTDYAIFDPSGLNVTEKFVNVELRPGTLRISEKEAVLGAKRDADEDEAEAEESESVVSEDEEIVEIEDEDAAKADSPYEFMNSYSLELVMYIFLILIMLAVFIVFIRDSNKMREK